MKILLKEQNIHTTLKLFQIIFITFYSIDKHPSYALQMHIHTHK